MVSVAVIGSGINGVATAIHLLGNEFREVKIFSKENYYQTHSDAAVATWFAPDDKRPLLQELCLQSLLELDALSHVKNSGVSRIPIVYYFKSQEEFNSTALSKKEVSSLLHATQEIPAEVPENKEFPFRVLASVPLMEPCIYRPFLWSRFLHLGGSISIQKIENGFDELFKLFDIVVNCSGWEAKYLTDDSEVFPARGQLEIKKMDEVPSTLYSLNIQALDTYVVFRPGSKDCVLGTTYQAGDSSTAASLEDKEKIIQNAALFYPEIASWETKSKVGIRCGRKEIRLESEILNTEYGKKLLIHCYGHGGSGYSAAWGSAKKVLGFCQEFKK